MDVSLLNPFAHAVPKSVDGSIQHANAACIAFNHSSTAPALLTATNAQPGALGSAREAAAHASSAAAAAASPNAQDPTSQGAAALNAGTSAAAPPTAGAESSHLPGGSTTTDNRPHSLFAGHYLAAGRLDGIVAIWDIETRSCLRWFDAHVKQVTSVAWSPHGRYLASSSLDWNVIVWDLGLKTGSPQPARKHTVRFDAPVLKVRFSPVSSLLLLAVLETQQAFVIDLRRPKYTLEQVPLPEASVNGTHLADHAGPSSQHASASETRDDTAEAGIALVPPQPIPPDPSPSITLEAATYTTATFTPDGKLIFAGTTKGHLIVANPQTGETIIKLSATSPSAIRALAFDRTGSKLVINTSDRTIRTFLIEYNPALLPTSRGWPFPVPTRAGAKPDSTKDSDPTASAKLDGDRDNDNDNDDKEDEDKTMQIDEDTTNPSLSREPILTTAAVELLPVHKLTDLVNRTPWNGIGWSGDGGEYVYAGAAHKASHNIYIWDTATGTLEKVLQGPKDPLVDVDWHPTRPVIASVCSTGAIHLWFSKSEEAWSAYAPQFEELEENIQYEEREEEFDLEDEDELSRRKQDEEEALVDITGTWAAAYIPPAVSLLSASAPPSRPSAVALKPPAVVEGAVGPAEDAPADVQMEDAGLVNGSESGPLKPDPETGRHVDIGQNPTQVNGDDAPGALPNGHTNGDEGKSPAPANPNGQPNAEAHKNRGAFTWRWVRLVGSSRRPDGTSTAVGGSGDVAGEGLYESDDDVDPCFVIPVRLEDEISSLDGSGRSE
ncbi:hypothetical protein V8E36_003581 [Tilletia maclaganii]